MLPFSVKSLLEGETPHPPSTVLVPDQQSTSTFSAEVVVEGRHCAIGVDRDMDVEFQHEVGC